MYCRNCGNPLNSQAKFCRNCGVQAANQNSEIKQSWLARYKVLLISGSVVGVLLVGFVLLPSDSVGSGDSFAPLLAALKDADGAPHSSPIRKTGIDLSSRDDAVAGSVVDILCDDGGDGSGGSGTIVDPDGIVITNSHIIPQDSDENSTAINCVVTLPDPRTGKISEIYWAEPVLIPYVSNKYDLAFFEIGAPYVDKAGKAYGSTSGSFPSFWTNGCSNDDVRLGEAVTVYGYPTISAEGYYLTVTDGIVSAIPNDGTIVTSAKVSSGNSGGIAVDAGGCIIGIPSMISTDGDESLGIILSNAIIQEFLNDYGAYLEITN